VAEVTEWRLLDPKELDTPSWDYIAGIEIESYASPYDVPRAMHIQRYPDRCHLLVEFKYIGGKEEARPEIKDEHAKLWLGRDSQRLCKAEIDLERYKPEEMIKLIDNLPSKSQRPPRNDNYRITKNVLLSYLHALNYSECRPEAEGRERSWLAKLRTRAPWLSK